jgi:hypothetical protein
MLLWVVKELSIMKNLIIIISILLFPLFGSSRDEISIYFDGFEFDFWEYLIVEVSYTSDVDIAGGQFTIQGANVMSVEMDYEGFEVYSDPNNGMVNFISYSGNMIPAGQNHLLTVYLELTQEIFQICISAPFFLPFQIYEPIIPTIGDCLDIPGIECWGGYYDDCGVCCGGETIVECSYWNSQLDFGGAFDCAGECYGDAMLDDYGTCCGGSTGIDCVFDTDEDGIPDDIDNCPEVFNEFQLDHNENNIGDACEDLTCEELDGVVNEVYTYCESNSDCYYDSGLTLYEYSYGEGWMHFCCMGTVMNINFADEFYSSYPYLLACVDNFFVCGVDCNEYTSTCNNNSCIIIECPIDCMNVCNGDAIEDCAGVCLGDAFLNECGCVGGETGTEIDWCYGCTVDSAYNFDSEMLEDDGSCLFQGDINQSLSIDVIDIVELVGYILYTEPDEYQLWAGDLNFDNVLDVVDIVLLVEQILGAL